MCKTYTCRNCFTVYTEQEAKENTAKYCFNGTASDIIDLDEFNEFYCPECLTGYTLEE